MFWYPWINELQFKIYTMLGRLLLVRAEFGIGILISIYGFANDILNNFDRIPILQQFVNYYRYEQL